MIEVLNLSAFYGTKCILKNISFSLNSGTFTALCGKNGAGKTASAGGGRASGYLCQ